MARNSVATLAGAHSKKPDVRATQKIFALTYRLALSKNIAQREFSFCLRLARLPVFRSRIRVIPALLLTLPCVFAFAEGNVAAGSITAGQAAFRLCVQCHQVGPTARSSFAPQLNGIIGRPAATAAGYRYSKAMKNSGVVWTEDKLRAFLRAPSDVVPGTNMRFWGISDQQKITDLIAYLRTFPVQPTP